VVNFRCSPEVAHLLDELAQSEARSCSGALEALLRRVLDRKRAAWPLEQLVRWINKDDARILSAATGPTIAAGPYTGRKWMLETILGTAAKDRALQDVRQALGTPIPTLECATGMVPGLDSIATHGSATPNLDRIRSSLRRRAPLLTTPARPSGMRFRMNNDSLHHEAADGDNIIDLAAYRGRPAGPEGVLPRRRKWRRGTAAKPRATGRPRKVEAKRSRVSGCLARGMRQRRRP